MKSLRGVWKNYSHITQALTRIILLSKSNTSDAAEARGYLIKMENFQFILLLEIFKRIFSHIGPLTKYLQHENMDMMAAATKIEKCLKYIGDLRESFEEIKECWISS